MERGCGITTRLQGMRHTEPRAVATTGGTGGGYYTSKTIHATPPSHFGLVSPPVLMVSASGLMAGHGEDRLD